MVPQSPDASKKSVIAATIHTLDSARTSVNEASSESRDVQSMTWAAFIVSRDAIFSPVMLRRTLLSPTIENSRDIEKVFEDLIES